MLFTWLNQMLAQLKQLNEHFAVLVVTQRELVRTSQQQVSLLKRLVGALCPGPISLTLRSETMAGTIQYEVQLPEWPGEDSDVASGELTVQVGDGEAQVIPVEKGAAKVEGLSGPQDAAVKLSFVYVDDAGNRSAVPATFEGVLLDAIPPTDPGALGIAITGEV